MRQAGWGWVERVWVGAAAVGCGLMGGAAYGQGTSAVLTPPAGHVAYLTAHATGTQNYLCLPGRKDGGVATTVWTFVGPQATLATVRNGPTQQVGTHFLSPVPGVTPAAKAACTISEDGKALYCPSWQSSGDGTAVWGTKLASVVAGSDASCPTAGAVPCLLLGAVATQTEQIGVGVFARTTYIQRLNTTGGSAPAGSCKVGGVALVPYSADYTFFREERR